MISLNKKIGLFYKGLYGNASNSYFDYFYITNLKNCLTAYTQGLPEMYLPTHLSKGIVIDFVKFNQNCVNYNN